MPETRLALIHRTIVPDRDYPKEYAVLVTDLRTIFIRLPKTRSSFVLRREMSYGIALTTDVEPKTLEDFAMTTLESIVLDSANLTVNHNDVTSLALRKERSKPSRFNVIVRMAMRLQKEDFQVYNFELPYHDRSGQTSMVKFYMVPLGAYFKPRRQTQT